MATPSIDCTKPLIISGSDGEEGLKKPELSEKPQSALLREQGAPQRHLDERLTFPERMLKGFRDATPQQLLREERRDRQIVRRRRKDDPIRVEWLPSDGGPSIVFHLLTYEGARCLKPGTT